MKTKIILTAVFALIMLQLSAQNFTKTGIAKIRLKNSGSIVQDNQVKGYYFFYNLEKKDKKNNNYMLSVYDENLREINSINIVKPVNYALVDGAFNGDYFAFMFYDVKKKTAEFVSYDKTLKQAGTSSRLIKNVSLATTFANMARGADATQPYLEPVSGKGFFYYGMKDVNKLVYEVEFYDNMMRKVWSEKASDKGPNVQLASEAFQSREFIGTLIVKKKTLQSKDVDVELLVQKIDNGQVQFRAPMATSKYSVSFSDVYYDSVKSNFVVFGEYYDKDDKELKAQSLGFIYLTLDMNGKIVGEKVNSWATEISRVTPMNEKGKVEGSNTNILIHDIIRTNDGQIFVIGEQYKKVASGGGIALQALSIAAGAATGTYAGSNASTSQLNVYNMVIFQFNADYTINKMHIFEKDKNEVLLPAGATYTSSKLLSYYAKAIGGFDYSFSQLSSDRSTFSVSYINYDRQKGEKAKNVLGSVVYTPEKVFSVDKLALNRKSTEYFVYKAKEGYVLITEYFKKEKKIETRLEKINY
jgi:hypothetical protein